MARVLVIYVSQEGNTKSLAEAVAAGAREAGAQVAVQTAQNTTNEDLVAADAIAAGSPVSFGNMAGEMKTLWDRSVTVRERLADKLGAAFTTTGHPAGGRDTALLSILQAMLIHEMIVMGDPISHGGHYGVSCTGSPTERDLAAGKAMGRRLARLADRFAGTS